MKKNSYFEEARRRTDALVMPAVARLDRLAYRWLEQRLARQPQPLTIAEFRIVGILLGEPEGLSQRDIAKRLGVRPPTVAVALPRLQAAGVIDRAQDPADARALRVRLTATPAQLEPVFRLVYELENLIFDELTAEQSEALRKSLTHAANKLNDFRLEDKP